MSIRKKDAGAELKKDEETTDNMVLRTVFLPIELDQDLRDFASQSSVSKGEIVRRAVTTYLTRR